MKFTKDNVTDWFFLGLLYAASLTFVVSLSYALVNVAMAENRITRCYVEWERFRPAASEYLLMGSVDWGMDRTIGTFATYDEAAAACVASTYR